MSSTRTVDENGLIEYKNEKGLYHRIDGPAIERPNGTKEWILNNKFHREDGPARILHNGMIYYYLNGLHYMKEDWEEEVLKIKLGRIKDL